MTQLNDGSVEIVDRYLGVSSEKTTLVLDDEEWRALHEMLGELE